MYKHLSSDILKNLTPIKMAMLMAMIAIWIVYIQQGWVTQDSILYYEMARLISLGEWKSAYEMFQWPFYPALVALIHTITHLSFQHSGNLLSVIFITITAWGLTQIVASIGGSARAQVLSVIILLGSRYIVGDIMPMSTRDQGYWAMMTIALWQFILFHQHRRLSSAMFWQVFAIVGTLFRIEGAVLLVTLPWLVFMLPKRTLKQKQTAFFWSVSLLIAGLITGIIVLLFLQITELAHVKLYHLGRIKEILSVFSDIANNINHNFLYRVDMMRDEVIGEPFKEFAWFTFVLSLFSISVVKCVFVAGVAPAILTIAYRRTSKSLFESNALRILLAVLLITWITGCIVILRSNILSGRYVIIFGIVLVAISAVILDDQLKRSSKQSLKQKYLLYICILIISTGLIGNIWPKKAGYAHERDAVEYVKNQLKADQKALYTTSRQHFYAGATYRAGDFDDWLFVVKSINDLSVNDYAYLVIRMDINQDTEAKEAYLNSTITLKKKTKLRKFKLDKVFYGYKKKKRICVYKRIED